MMLSIAEIKELMQELSRTGLSAIELSEEEFSLKLTAAAPVVYTPAAIAPAPVPVASTESAAVPLAVSSTPTGDDLITAPIVGTFYSAPTPDAAPYVSAGDTVKIGDVLFIIESMKLMNEVLADRAGTVREVFAKNGQAVEYGQPVMRIE